MDIQYLIRLEEKMQNELLRLCTDRGALKGVLLATEDIDEHWKILAPEYMGDAVLEIAKYPTVSVSWAAYLGMAVAYGWDADWETFRKMPYQSYYGEQGFDDMDEYIVQNILGLSLDSQEAKQLMNILLCCAQKAVTFIRHEHIEAQTVKAFHIFARTVKVMYKTGAAIQLRRLGYKLHKISLDRNS